MLHKLFAGCLGVNNAEQTPGAWLSPVVAGPGLATASRTLADGSIKPTTQLVASPDAKDAPVLGDGPTTEPLFLSPTALDDLLKSLTDHGCSPGGVPVVCLPSLQEALDASPLACVVVHVNMSIEPDPLPDKSLEQQGAATAEGRGSGTSRPTHGVLSQAVKQSSGQPGEDHTHTPGGDVPHKLGPEDPGTGQYTASSRITQTAALTRSGSLGASKSGGTPFALSSSSVGPTASTRGGAFPLSFPVSKGAGPAAGTGTAAVLRALGVPFSGSGSLTPTDAGSTARLHHVGSVTPAANSQNQSGIISLLPHGSTVAGRQMPRPNRRLSTALGYEHNPNNSASALHLIADPQLARTSQPQSHIYSTPSQTLMQLVITEDEEHEREQDAAMRDGLFVVHEAIPDVEDVDSSLQAVGGASPCPIAVAGSHHTLASPDPTNPPGAASPRCEELQGSGVGMPTARRMSARCVAGLPAAGIACGEYAARMGELNASLLGTHATLSTLRSQLHSVLGPPAAKDQGVSSLAAVQERDGPAGSIVKAAKSVEHFGQQPQQRGPSSGSSSDKHERAQDGAQGQGVSRPYSSTSSARHRGVRRNRTMGALMPNAEEMRRAAASLGHGTVATVDNGAAPRLPGIERQHFGAGRPGSHSTLTPPPTTMHPHVQLTPAAYGCTVADAKPRPLSACSAVKAVSAMPSTNLHAAGHAAGHGPSSQQQQHDVCQRERSLEQSRPLVATCTAGWQSHSLGPTTEEHVIHEPQLLINLAPKPQLPGHSQRMQSSPSARSAPATPLHVRWLPGAAQLIARVGGKAAEARAAQLLLDADAAALTGSRTSGLPSIGGTGQRWGSLTTLLSTSVAGRRQLPGPLALEAAPKLSTLVPLLPSSGSNYNGRPNVTRPSSSALGAGRASGDLSGPARLTDTVSTDIRHDVSLAGGLQVSFANQAALKLLDVRRTEQVSRLLADHLCSHPSVVTTLDELMHCALMDAPATVEQLLPAFRAHDGNRAPGSDLGMYHLSLVACNLTLPDSQMQEPAVLMVFGVPELSITCGAAPRTGVARPAGPVTPHVPAAELMLLPSQHPSPLALTPRSLTPARAAAPTWGISPMLQLMMTALSHTPAILTILTLDGEILYQNGRSIDFLGLVCARRQQPRYKLQDPDHPLRRMFNLDPVALESLLEGTEAGQVCTSCSCALSPAPPAVACVFDGSCT